MVESPGVDIHAPALCDVEVASALRKGRLTGRLTGSRLSAAVEDYLALPITRHGHQALLPRMLQLAENFSAYDAAYVALAERLEAELLTADGGLKKAIHQRLGLELALP